MKEEKNRPRCNNASCLMHMYTRHALGTRTGTRTRIRIRTYYIPAYEIPEYNS